MRFKGNFKTAAIAALGLLLLATVAGLAISALTTVRDATEGTPAEFVGVSAEVAVGPVTAMVAVAPTSPIDATAASANSNAPPVVASVSGTRSENGKQIAASWTAVEEATHYHLNYKLHDGTDWFRYVDYWPDTSVTMKGLQHTKGYTLAVQSVKKEGEDVYAYGWTESDMVEAPAPPALVTGITAERSANGAEIKVNWDKVDDATHYHLNYTDDDGESWHRYVSDIPAKKVPPAGANDYAITMTGLAKKKAHTLAVQSVRKVGDVSFAYGWFNSDPVHAPPGAPAITSYYLSVGSEEYVVEWDDPSFRGTGADANSLKFNIYCRFSGSGESWSKIVSDIDEDANSDSNRYGINVFTYAGCSMNVAVEAVNDELAGERATATR